MSSYLQKFSLAKKIAFVSGGVGLLGTEVVKALADAKARVVILDINRVKGKEVAKQLQKLGKDVVFEEFDITDLTKADLEITRLAQKYKKIDVWVNTAYPRTADWGQKVEDLNLKSWQKNVDMHLNSYSWVSRQVCLVMKEQQGGSLINFGSIFGVVGNNFSVYQGTTMTSPMGYAAIKGGIVNLDRYLAAYFGPFKVRVNTICPGGIFYNQNPTFVENYAKLTPLGRMGNPSDIAGAVLFLASDASSYVTGTTLMVDGGWTAI